MGVWGAGLSPCKRAGIWHEGGGQGNAVRDGQERWVGRSDGDTPVSLDFIYKPVGAESQHVCIELMRTQAHSGREGGRGRD